MSGLNGLFVELSADNIDEGEMLTRLNATIKKASSELMKLWEENSSRAGGAVITLKINIDSSKESEDYVSASYSIDHKLPARRARTLAKCAAGRLLAQPSGSSQHSPDQMKFVFDGTGRIKGQLSQDGELIEVDGEVAGKVG